MRIEIESVFDIDLFWCRRLIKNMEKQIGKKKTDKAVEIRTSKQEGDVECYTHSNL